MLWFAQASGSEDYETYPGVIAAALAKLRIAGVDGPYAIALGPQCYTGVTQTITKGGFPVIRNIERLLDDRIIWAPAVEGAVVVSLRGGDFELVVGRDMSIGYENHSATTVELYIEECVSFRVLSPEAGVPLLYHSTKKRKTGTAEK